MKLQKAEQTDSPVIQKFYWDVFENRSRLLFCLVYHGSACFTGFPGHQSFWLVLKSSVRFVVNVVNLRSKNDEKWRVLIK